MRKVYALFEQCDHKTYKIKRNTLRKNILNSKSNIRKIPIA